MKTFLIVALLVLSVHTAGAKVPAIYFDCSADSNPTATITIALEGSEVSASELGSFECEKRNDVGRVCASAQHHLVISPEAFSAQITVGKIILDGANLTCLQEPTPAF